MSLVSGIDLFYPGQDFGVILKRQHPLPDREPVDQAGVLDQDRQVGSEITYTSVTEPTRAHLDVSMFGYAKFRAGFLNKLAISLRRSRGDFARDYLPAIIRQ